MKTTYTVRPARSDDLDRLVELLLALQTHIEAANPDLWRMTAEARTNIKGQISARLTAPNACALVAEHENDGVVGVVFGRIVTNKRYTPARAGLVDQLVVQEDHRRRGVGSQLMAALCRFFADQGVDDLSLRYVKGNQQAASFWQSLGFSPRITTAGAHRQVVEAQLAPFLGL